MGELKFARAVLELVPWTNLSLGGFCCMGRRRLGPGACEFKLGPGVCRLKLGPGPVNLSWGLGALGPVNLS